MEQPTASQVILTNTAFMLKKQLKEVTQANIQLRMENAKLKSKLELIENYANELGEKIFKSTEIEKPEYSFEVGV